jgi:hypothetical protein
MAQLHNLIPLLESTKPMIQCKEKEIKPQERVHACKDDENELEYRE